MQEIIVYRNPAEAAFWQLMSNGEFFPIIVGAAVAIIVFGCILHFERKVAFKHRKMFTNAAFIVSGLSWIAVSYCMLSKI